MPDFLAAGVAGRTAARRAAEDRWGDVGDWPITKSDLIAVLDVALDAALPHLAVTLPADAIATVRPGDRLLIVWPDGRPPTNELVAELRKLLGIPLVVLGGDVRVAVIQGDDVALRAPSEEVQG